MSVATSREEPADRAQWIWAIAVAIVTFVAFAPSLGNGLVNWDDDGTLGVEGFRALDGEHLRWMFSTLHMAHWQPLSWITFAIDYRLGGLAPRGYHLTNVLWHCASSVLCFFLAARLYARASAPARERRTWLHLCAAGAALAFAIHPLRVESVAWVTERRDVVSGFFYLATLLVYLRSDEAAGRRRAWLLAACFGLFCLALSAKSFVFTLPLVLFVLDRWPLARGWSLRRALEKLPFLVVATVICAVGYVGQKHAGALRPAPLGARIAQSIYGWVFYLRKEIWPSSLSPFYEPPNPFDPLADRFLVSAAALVAILALVIATRRRWPALVAALAAYTITVGPALGLVKFGKHLAADRYSYLACIPLAILAGGALHATAPRLRAATRGLIVVICASLLALSLHLTRVQCTRWRDSETLWRWAVMLDARSPLAHDLLSLSLREEGKSDEAADECRRARAFPTNYRLWCDR